MKRIVNKVGRTRLPILVNKGVDGLQIGGSDGLGIGKEFHIFFEILKEGRLLKGELQLISIQKMKYHHIASLGAKLLQSPQYLLGLIEEVGDENDDSTPL